MRSSEFQVADLQQCSQLLPIHNLQPQLLLLMLQDVQLQGDDLTVEGGERRNSVGYEIPLVRRLPAYASTLTQ